MTASHRQAPARPSRMNAGGPVLQVYCNFHVERTSRVCNLQCAARFPQVETCPCTSWQELNTRRTCATGSSTLLISISRTGLHLQVTATDQVSPSLSSHLQESAVRLLKKLVKVGIATTLRILRSPENQKSSKSVFSTQLGMISIDTV